MKCLPSSAHDRSICPLVSIIIPFHNRLDLLLELLGSIPPLPCIELILVDDNSTDSLSRLYAYKSNHLQIIPNTGPDRYAGAARNIGIDRSRGEYLLFADSDDLFFPDKFSSVISLLSSSLPDILFVKTTSFIDGSADLGSRHLRHNWLVDRVLSGDDPKMLVRSSGPIAKFVRRHFVVDHGIRFDHYRLSEDIGFVARVMVENPVVAATSDVLYSIRQGNVSLTSLRDRASVEIRLNALLQYNRILYAGGLSQYLVPAVAHFRLLWPRNILTIVKWIIVFAYNRQPLFLTSWTVGNKIRAVSSSISSGLHGSFFSLIAHRS
jgi:glycosyltransferase involved in cell wall biosynthesis